MIIDYNKSGEYYNAMIKIEQVKVFVQQPLALKLLNPQKNELILELGCGNGTVSRMVLKCGAKTIGFDSSSNQIAKAIQSEKKNVQKVEYFISTPQKFSYGEQFDKVFGAMFFAYAENLSELQIFFGSAYSFLKKGGKLIIVDVDKGSIPIGKEYYNRKWTRLPNGNILLEWLVPEFTKFVGEIPFYKKTEFEGCALKAGFKNIKFEKAVPMKKGIEEMGKEYWKEFIEKPVWFGMVCER